MYAAAAQQQQAADGDGAAASADGAGADTGQVDEVVDAEVVEGEENR